MGMVASYTKLTEARWKEKIEALWSMAKSCTLCPRKCGVNRLKKEEGYCRAPFLKISSAFPHHGEEPPISGWAGSGTIFFSNCNLRCVFCQNYEISHLSEGEPADTDALARIMIMLQGMGVHNINLVTPTHYTPWVAEAIYKATKMGLKIPIVYNTSAYDSSEVIKILEGIVDIYMPDFKFWNPESSLRYCRAPDYPEIAKETITLMHKQTGDLIIQNGIAQRGVLVRHLVMPGATEESKAILKFLKELSENMFISLLSQYRPCFRAHEFPEINRPISISEYREVASEAKALGLKRVYYQLEV